MKHLLNVFLVLALYSCVHNQKARVKSGWHTLTKAKETKCVMWPLREKDLRVESIETYPGDHPGFFVTVVKRDASKGHYFAPMKESLNLSPEEFLAISLPPDALLVGGTTIQGELYAIVWTSGVRGSALEIKHVSSGVVAQRLPLSMGRAVAGRVIPGSQGNWIILEDHDGRHRLFFLRVGPRDRWELRDLKIDLEEPPKALVVRGGLLLSFRSSKDSRHLKTIWIQEKEATDHRFKASPGAILNLGESVEAWTVGLSDEGAILAAIVGDSLVGEASLRVGKIDLASKNGALKFIGRSDLKDIHATEPSIIQTARWPEVLIVNWVDEESTIARYIVHGEDISKPLFSGLFHKGTRIVGQLSPKDPSHVLVLTRHRVESRWVYQICGL